MEVKLADIKDGGAQARVEMSHLIIQEYAEAMRNGDIFPPVIVFFDGTDHWLAEGYHRLEANKQIGRDSISAEVRSGTARDAILFGIGANASHGLRRSQADKRRAVERLLTDPEWAGWSDRKIAEAAKVDHKTVAKVRRELSGEIPTAESMNGEIPKVPTKANGSSNLLATFLLKVTDDALRQECRRRGPEFIGSLVDELQVH
jgi:hypothetical protein